MGNRSNNISFRYNSENENNGSLMNNNNNIIRESSQKKSSQLYERTNTSGFLMNREEAPSASFFSKNENFKVFLIFENFEKKTMLIKMINAMFLKKQRKSNIFYIILSIFFFYIICLIFLNFSIIHV